MAATHQSRAPLRIPLSAVPEELDVDGPQRPRPAQLELATEPEHDAINVRSLLVRCIAKTSSWLVTATFGCYVWVLICFWTYHKMMWFVTLACIVLMSAISRISGFWMVNHALIRRSFDSFFFGMPLALFCFYGYFITHRNAKCEWFIQVASLNGASVVGGSLLICGWVTVFSMGLAAFRIDRNADGECNELAQRRRTYRIWHIAFRMSELAYRITMAVVVSDCIRIAAPPFIVKEWGPPALLCMPYIVLILVYSAILYWANPPVPGKARDDVVAVLVVAITMLGINSVFFLDRYCCREAAGRARARLQLIRFCELVLFSVAVLHSWTKHFPSSLCSDLTDEAFGPWVLQHRPATVGQMLASLLLHYVLLYKHPYISRRRGQPIPPAAVRFSGDDSSTVGDSSTVSLSLGPRSLSPQSLAPQTLAPQQSLASTVEMTRTQRPGMCQTLVRLGGLGVVARLTGAIELDDVTSFKHLTILGYGQYGVVVLTKREETPETPSENGGQRHFAMKLVNTRRRQGQVQFRLRTPEELFKREKDVYRRVWQEPAIPDPEDRSMASRVGHPFIVKLHYFFKCPDNRNFNIVDTRPDGTTIVTPITHQNCPCFHEGLIMEYCEEGSLESYLKKNFTEGGNKATFEEFVLVRLFLAEILLALDYLHRVKQVVYRDLNLSNVFVVKRRRLGAHVKLGDFGFSKKMDAETHECSVAGTPYWYAPEMREQHMHGKPLDTTVQGHLALDIYSFGMVVFALAHGIPYLPEPPPGCDHPMCQSSMTGVPADGGEATGCAPHHKPPGSGCPFRGCSSLRTLEWRFPTHLGNACIRDLVRDCIAPEPNKRPTTEALRKNPMFTSEFGHENPSINMRAPRINFGELLSLQI